TETGTVFHLMGALSEFGKVGVTSIGNSLQQAEDIYNRVVKVLDEETQQRPSANWPSQPHVPITWQR
ncbi:MAG TPA: peptide ligase PGM1-related protein, partial [Candidatus Obscuribacterales bacterium]